MSEKLDNFFISQIKEILEDYEKNSHPGPKKANNLITRVKAVIVRTTGKSSEYYYRIQETLEKWKKWKDEAILEHVMGVLDGLYHDLKSGYLKTLSELIHAELFSNFLEMSEYILKEGYKDASAVIAGSTLEEHLRKLCKKNEIEVETETSSGQFKPKKAEQMNSDLYKQNIYSKLEQKQITAWLDIRNNAAHAHYDRYNEKQVELLIMGLKDFFIRFPV